jgi:hypothetical protein
MREIWRPRLNILVQELHRAPAVLHLTYLADLEDPRLVDARVEVMRREIEGLWKQSEEPYSLDIEPEIFWRRGAPPESSEQRARRGEERP